jgi:hypothetical protein
MTRSALRPALLALAAAAALGLVGRMAVHAGSELPHGDALSAAGRAFVALGAPWLAVAWAVGAASERRVVGAAAGALSLALATVAWYSLSVAAGGAATNYYAWPVAPAWAVVALVAGGALGLAGATWPRGVALPAGALAGEALLLAGDWSARAAQAVLAVELGVALALVGWAARRRPAVIPVAIACAVAMALGEHTVRDALRVTGWAGP